jgi:hypothetical protein
VGHPAQRVREGKDLDYQHTCQQNQQGHGNCDRASQQPLKTALIH